MEMEPGDLRRGNLYLINLPLMNCVLLVKVPTTGSLADMLGRTNDLTNMQR